MGNVDYEWTGGALDDGLPYPTQQSSPNAARDLKKLAETAHNLLVDLEAHVDDCCPKLPDTNIFVSSQELTWDDLPASAQPDNGSLKLLSTEVRDNVPVLVETGNMIEKRDYRTKETTLVPETKVEHETRTVYTYEADFDWSNAQVNSISWWSRRLVWLVDVLQFKNNQLKDAYYAFYFMPAAELAAIPDLDISNLTDLGFMFYYAQAFNQSVNHFETGHITNMRAVFSVAHAFNQPLDTWDTSSVESMGSMFSDANAFNQPLDNFDTSSVRWMYGMFASTHSFKQRLDNFDTSNVVDMSGMFSGSAFNHPLDTWDTSNVTDMDTMFASSAFNQPLDWDTSSCGRFEYMFHGNSSMNSPLTLIINHLDDYDVQSGYLDGMFYNASSFNQDISHWCAENIKRDFPWWPGPSDFDRGAGFEGQRHLQPQWGDPCDG